MLSPYHVMEQLFMKQARTQKDSVSLNVLLSIILVATLTRIALPPIMGHPPNFSAIDALALFSGAYFSRRSSAFIVILLSVWIGDIMLNRIFMGDWQLFYPGCYWQYGAYLLITCLGSTLKHKAGPIKLSATCLTSSILFFTISNFGVWTSGFLYPLNFDGLIACYVAAIPFFKNTLLSDLFFSFLLFGVFQLLNSKQNMLYQKA